MVKIVIRTVADIERLQVKLRSLKAILPRLQQIAITKASDDILDTIHTRMELNNFSDKIIRATSVGKFERLGSVLRQHFISNYVADNDFDVSNAREEGTTHTKPIVPKKKGGILRWFGAGGNPIFRKFSKPKGIERLLIIEKTLKQNTDQFKTKYTANLTESVSKVLGV